MYLKYDNFLNTHNENNAVSINNLINHAFICLIMYSDPFFLGEFIGCYFSPYGYFQIAK